MSWFECASVFGEITDLFRLLEQNIYYLFALTSKIYTRNLCQIIQECGVWNKTFQTTFFFKDMLITSEIMDKDDEPDGKR